MSGSALLGLIVVSMGWLFFVMGFFINLQALRKGGRGIPLLPGVAGSVASFFTVLWLQPPLPWLWILLPLVLDLLLLRRK